MQKQAEEFGCEFLTNIEIANLVLTSGEKSAELKTGEKFTAKAIILATGGKSRTLGVTGEKELTGRGISYCATCDGDFFTDKEIIVVGGGNSAVEEAVALTKYASKVTIVHQFDHFQAYPGALEEARRNEKIHFLTESVVTEFRGDNSVEHAVIKNIKTDTETVMKTDGAFIFIGYVPQTQMFEGKIELNERKEVLTDDNLQTSAEGVFAAGDLRNKKHRQITTAVSDGTVAALNAIDYIHSKA
jgi:thioredoxin reductase (NADPH)